jgi:hypothetical protein
MTRDEIEEEAKRYASTVAPRPNRRAFDAAGEELFKSFILLETFLLIIGVRGESASIKAAALSALYGAMHYVYYNLLEKKNDNAFYLRRDELEARQRNRDY